MRAITLFVIVLLTSFAFAENSYAPDTPEAGSIESIAKATTDPKYMSRWVSYVPESSVIPSPSDFFGHIAGSPGELPNSQRIYDYYRELDRKSERVKLQTIGRTEEGREILLVIIADEAGIQTLDQLKAATAALADARKTSPEQADQIVRNARPMYYMNAAVHADESGSPDMFL
ncbi:MAG TPA: M14 family zinc carboxypeptidase, partial [Acidobacteriota bacterium]|nr:M14 family zinc carboxypeptidase [Acidobacteriota bacterium]